MVAPRNGVATPRPSPAPWWRGTGHLRGLGRSRWPHWLLWPARPALVVALLGLVGLAVTQPLAPYPAPGGPRSAGPIRYDAGPPLADRLVIIFAPTLDGPGVAALGAALRQGYAERGAGGTAQFAVARPQYASFADATMLILAGNAPPTAGSNPPDTLVRVIDDRAATGTEGRGQVAAALVGPDGWRALFGRAPEPRLPDRLTVATPEAAARATLAAAGTALRERAPLTAIYLEEVTAREPGGELAALGRELDDGDALLIVGGGGGLGAPLAGLLSGPAVPRYPASAPPRPVALNDLAPTCAVLLGVGYPSEARGRIAWPLLVADERHKAVATAALARQRTTLAAHSLPLGTVYPQLLGEATRRLPQIDGLIEQGQYAYAYQLASSSVDEADRALATAASATPLDASW